VPDVETAKELGNRNQQAGVWDAGEETFIPTGGTGEAAAEKTSDEVLTEFDEVIGSTEDQP